MTSTPLSAVILSMVRVEVFVEEVKVKVKVERIEG